MRRSPLKRVSERRQGERADYDRAVSDAFARDRWKCQGIAVIPGHVCRGRLDPHHVWPVGKGGPRCDAANIKVLCREAHQWVHNGNPQLARTLGLLA